MLAYYALLYKTQTQKFIYNFQGKINQHYEGKIKIIVHNNIIKSLKIFSYKIKYIYYSEYHNIQYTDWFYTCIKDQICSKQIYATDK